MLRRTVTDEGSPPPAGLTAVRTFAILWLAAVAARTAPTAARAFAILWLAAVAASAPLCTGSRQRS